MLRVLLASSCLYVVCWCITQIRASIYIGRYLNESYIWHVFYISKQLCEFYYEEKVHYKVWERFNKLNLMLMRMVVADNIKTALPKTDNAKKFMGLVGNYSQTADKSLAGTLMSTLTTMKFDGSCIMYEHVIEMINIAARLKTLGMIVNVNFLVQLFWTRYHLSMTHFKWAIIPWKINGMCMNCTIC